VIEISGKMGIPRPDLFPVGTEITPPVLSLVALPITLAAFPWITGRCTLRSRFIATPFLAIVLGIIAWLDHACIGK
jgi:hypothetical protein